MGPALEPEASEASPAASGARVAAPYVRAFLFITSLKLLLVPCYKSTDFEVHRNWLAVCSRPVSRWYVDATSEWTLDYPPLFGWFARLVSIAARRVDPGMLTLSSAPYDSPATTTFMRCSVIASDALLAAGAFAWTNGRGRQRQRAIATILVLLNPGLLLVDHVHFQYNGALFGLLSCALAAVRARRPVLAAALFSALVHAKHFAAVAIAVTAASFGPVVASGTFSAMLARLFPFGRGLSHAYWAPNAWALYNFTDKCLAAAARKLGVGATDAPKAHLVGGMAGHGGTGAQTHAVLPTITPGMTFALTALFSAPALAAHWRAALRVLSHATLCAFTFGWHVHEKASLMATIPLALALAADADSAGRAGEFWLLSTTSSYALSPLLFQPREWPIKILVLLIGAIVSRRVLETVVEDKARAEGVADADGGGEEWTLLRSTSHRAYVVYGLPALELYVSVGHRLVFGEDALEFLPLMLTSTYCAVGVVGVFAKQWIAYVREVFE
ncbi:uncharacterized protein MICPUCDRAFT_32727 [Micromonas pusilla CCMP1545]|uniref:Alpha-1,3-glucosyltransferase n=1 Tax=Micromonas pusilla (strain CCMP1545) TaxID=564608 RepID=C1MPF5_MICPC|nr:uncharacterized protein MICPUCDRAFT_32727 [Micromonas pusilla CCMP1545]EEH57901.1 hypothetical protein MICPUCDRAFT_32727 [Micromonas pusilla CCMP1545]|eukprot:XP_003057950.1 hypothetical protein MICPUCDRAFT_32727 [Micromonas pusilla CCMP1545]